MKHPSNQMAERNTRTFTTLSAELPLSAAALKYIAVITMLIDHVAMAMMKAPELQQTRAVLRDVGRTAFPIYCFFIAEGFLRSRNRLRYLGLLLLTGVVSQAPYIYALYPGRPLLYRLNVEFTLAIGLAALIVYDFLAEKLFRASSQKNATPLWSQAGELLTLLAVTCGACYLANLLNTSYRWCGVLLIVLFYALRNHPYAAAVAGSALVIWFSKTEIWAIPAFLLLTLYNGERGRQNKLFFYAFYPGHLAIIALLS